MTAPGPTIDDVLDMVRAATSSRFAVVCGPDHADMVREAIDQLNADWSRPAVEIVVSDEVPSGRVLVANLDYEVTHASDAASDAFTLRAAAMLDRNDRSPFVKITGTA